MGLWQANAWAPEREHSKGGLLSGRGAHSRERRVNIGRGPGVAVLAPEGMNGGEREGGRERGREGGRERGTKAERFAGKSPSITGTHN